MKMKIKVWTVAVLSILVLTSPTVAQSGPPLPPPFKKPKARIRVVTEFPYLVFLPSGYRRNKDRWPLVVFLHGARDAGTNIDRLKEEISEQFSHSHGTHGSDQNVPDFPFILLAPQSQVKDWDLAELNKLLDGIIANYHVDPDRVYLTGLDMGGSATWALALAHPEKFAAIVPVGGSGDAEKARKLRGVPIWAFHGGKDTTVPLELDQKMVGAVKMAGGNVKFTVYPDAGHEVWNRAYQEPDLFRWLLQQTRARAN